MARKKSRKGSIVDAIDLQDVKEAKAEASRTGPALDPTRFNQLFDAHIANRMGAGKEDANEDRFNPILDDLSRGAAPDGKDRKVGPSPDLKESFPQHGVKPSTAYAPQRDDVGNNVVDAEIQETDRRAANFMSRYRERSTESKTKAAFIEFFDLVSKLNETAHAVGIRGATLDADSGDITVTFRSRTEPTPSAT